MTEPDVLSILLVNGRDSPEHVCTTITSSSNGKSIRPRYFGQQQRTYHYCYDSLSDLLVSDLCGQAAVRQVEATRTG